MTLDKRLAALELSQDCTCSACWESFIRDMGAYRNALCLQGVPEDVVHRYLALPVAGTISPDEQALIDVAQTHVQAEYDAANRAGWRYDAMSVACAGWLERRINTYDDKQTA